MQIHLFASMPSIGRVTAAKTASCKELVRHWQFYIARSRSLQKVFVSVKGIYYQAVIMGEEITWLAPHPFTQIAPKEVDFRVMITFLDFYEVFMKFVLFKLYSTLGVKYPPSVDVAMDRGGGQLLAISAMDTTEKAEVSALSMSKPSDSASSRSSSTAMVVDKRFQNVSNDRSDEEGDENSGNDDEDDDDDGVDNAQVMDSLTKAFASVREDDDDDRDEESRNVFAVAQQGEEDDSARQALFRNLVFFINREVCLEWMQLCVLSHHGAIGWDGPNSPFTAADPRITHHVVDRTIDMSTFPSREFVQPQWVFDSINAKLLLPVGRYQPGHALPPHLSPFVDDSREGYLPKYRADILRLLGSEPAEGHEGDKHKAFDEVVHSESEDEAYGDIAKNKEMESMDEEEENDDEDDEEEESEHEQVGAKAKGPKGIVFKPKEQLQTEVCSYVMSVCG